MFHQIRKVPLILSMIHLGNKMASREDCSCDRGIKGQEGLDKAVGNTPLIYLKAVSKATGCAIYAKAEFMNPTGSVKVTRPLIYKYY